MNNCAGMCLKGKIDSTTFLDLNILSHVLCIAILYIINITPISLVILYEFYMIDIFPKIKLIVMIALKNC